MKPMFGKRAVFLDRDGVLVKAIYRPDFVKKITCAYTVGELEFVPGAVSVLARLKEMGFLRIMVTNQPDVALKYMDESEWLTIHRRVLTFLNLDDFIMCRHTTEQNCPLKKPSPLMLRVMADKWDIDRDDIDLLPSSYMVGDTDADIGAGKAAGCKTILVTSGEHNVVNWREDCPKPTMESDFQVDKLTDILKIIR